MKGDKKEEKHWKPSPEKARQYRKKYYDTHRDEIRQKYADKVENMTDEEKEARRKYWREYHHSHKEAESEKAKKYAASHPEKMAENHKKYRDNHRNEINEYRRWNMRKKQVEALTAEIKKLNEEKAKLIVKNAPKEQISEINASIKTKKQQVRICKDIMDGIGHKDRRYVENRKTMFSLPENETTPDEITR